MSKKSAESFKNAIDSLIRARDEARLGLHLLTMEGRTKWDELEKNASVLEQKLEENAEQLSEAHVMAAQNLAKAVKQFADLHLGKRSAGRST